MHQGLAQAGEQISAALSPFRPFHLEMNSVLTSSFSSLPTSLGRVATHSCVPDALPRRDKPITEKLLSGKSQSFDFLPCHPLWAQSVAPIRESPVGGPSSLVEFSP